MAAKQFGFASPQDAIDQRIYENDPDGSLQEMVIVGVAPTQNIVGFFQSDKPWVYWYEPDGFRVASIRISQGDILDTVDDIEAVWKRVVPEYPMQGRFLDDVFNDVYSVLRYMNLALTIFAGVALTLALIGLFGLAAFMAAQRTKEIGVRKVLGASSGQIARLLVWQFSKPVMWGLAFALPMAFFASQMYLNFFGDRITLADFHPGGLGRTGRRACLGHRRRPCVPHCAGRPGAGTSLRVRHSPKICDSLLVFITSKLSRFFCFGKQFGIGTRLELVPGPN